MPSKYIESNLKIKSIIKTEFKLSDASRRVGAEYDDEKENQEDEYKSSAISEKHDNNEADEAEEEDETNKYRVCTECYKKIDDRLAELSTTATSTDEIAAGENSSRGGLTQISDDEYYDYDDDDVKSSSTATVQSREAKRSPSQLQSHSNENDEDTDQPNNVSTKNISPLFSQEGEPPSNIVGLIKNDKNNNIMLGEEIVEKIMRHSTEETKNFINNLIESNKNNIEYPVVTHKQISEVTLSRLSSLFIKIGLSFLSYNNR